MHKLETNATKLYTWGTYDQVEIKSCKVVGQVRRDPEVREIINSTHSIFTLRYAPLVGFYLPPRGGGAGPVAGVSRHSSLGRTGGRCLKREVLEGQQARGLGLLAARFVPEPNTHCRDEGGSLAAPIFG